eukprot:4648999-Alexandrium_andersonii.AAC.1
MCGSTPVVGVPGQLQAWFRSPQPQSVLAPQAQAFPKLCSTPGSGALGPRSSPSNPSIPQALLQSAPQPQQCPKPLCCPSPP